MPLPAAQPGNRFAQALFAPLPERYDRLAEVLSMGQNARWRRAMIDKIAPAAADVKSTERQAASTSFTCLAGLKPSLRDAAISMVSPVPGLRP